MISMFLVVLTASKRCLVSGGAAFAADICNQLLDFYDEIQRQNAESAQAAATSSSTQNAARSDVAPSSAAMPQAKVKEALSMVGPPRSGVGCLGEADMKLGFVWRTSSRLICYISNSLRWRACVVTCVMVVWIVA